jgi:hypothetical protein
MKILETLLLVSVLASGCVRAHAKTTPDAPPLDVPAPPPRDVQSNEAEAPPPMSLVPEPARTVPQRPRPAPREQPRAEPAKADPVKPEPQPAEPPKPADDPPRPQPPTLQTVPATVESEVERGIRATLARATADLSRVDYRALNADARTQYDAAKRFISQADEAMRSRNLVFARNLAEKAAALAVQLAGQ